MLEAGKHLDHLDSTPAFFLIQCRDINAGNHLVLVRGCIANQEDLTVTLPEIQGDDQVRIVLRVRRGSHIATKVLLLHHHLLLVVHVALAAELTTRVRGTDGNGRILGLLWLLLNLAVHLVHATSCAHITSEV